MANTKYQITDSERADSICPKRDLVWAHEVDAMHYERLEELPVWKAAIETADLVFRMVEDKRFAYQGDFRRQLGSAALSVSNNVAEGFELNTTKDLIKFLYIARGSAGEVRSMLYVMARILSLWYLVSGIWYSSFRHG